MNNAMLVLGEAFLNRPRFWDVDSRVPSAFSAPGGYRCDRGDMIYLFCKRANHIVYILGFRAVFHPSSLRFPCTNWSFLEPYFQR